MKLMGNNREKKGISKKNIIYCDQRRAEQQSKLQARVREKRRGAWKRGEQRHEQANSGLAVIWRCLRD